MKDTDYISYIKSNGNIFEKFDDTSKPIIQNEKTPPTKRKLTMDDFVTKKQKLNDVSTDNLSINKSISNNESDIKNLKSDESYNDEIKSRPNKKRHILESSESENEDEIEEMTADDIKVLLYINTASVEDLTQISGLSESKANQIISHRPFNSFDDVSKAKMNQRMINGCLEIVNIKENLTKLLKTCEILSNNLVKKIEPLLTRVEIDETDKDFKVEIPENIQKGLQLKPYQIVGINWLRMLHEENLNGILADEMGLGKTVQAVSFLSYLFEKGFKGPHLIIVPTSTINNWSREINKWCPHLKVLIYHGSQAERTEMRYENASKLNNFNVMISTYNIAVSSKDDRCFVKKFQFHYGIFDEAHMLKNMLSIRYKYLSSFKITRKLLLTGTPLQNNLLELISLLSFVMPDIFLSENDGLKKIFQISQKPNQKQSLFNEEKIRNVKEMLTPFCLRRLKSQVLTQMPNKTVDVMFLPMENKQSEIYNELVVQARKEQNSGAKKTKLELNRVMELRKASNHSLLLRKHYNDDMLKEMSRNMLRDDDHVTSNPHLIFEDFSVMSDFEIHKHCIIYEHVIGKYKLDNDFIFHSNKIQYLDQQLPKLIAQGDKVLIFSQFVIVLDIVEEFLKHRQFKFLRLDGSTSSDDRQDYIDQFNEDVDLRIFLLTTRAGGLGINLTSANTVILHDIDYNPYNDRQAEDRSHRLGQNRDVNVIKLISKGTIDECILQVANEKLKLEQITSADICGNNGDSDIDDNTTDDGERSTAGTSDVSGASNNKNAFNHVDMNSLLRQALNLQ